MTKRIKQTLDISFWASDEDVANEAFDYVYDKWFKHDLDELEFEKFENDCSEGVTANWKVTAYRNCSYVAETRYEPEDIDYSSLIQDDEPKDWIAIFLKENNLDSESIDDVYVYENIEEDYDYDGYDD